MPSSEWRNWVNVLFRLLQEKDADWEEFIQIVDMLGVNFIVRAIVCKIRRALIIYRGNRVDVETQIFIQAIVHSLWQLVSRSEAFDKYDRAELWNQSVRCLCHNDDIDIDGKASFKRLDHESLQYVEYRVNKDKVDLYSRVEKRIRESNDEERVAKFRRQSHLQT